MNLEFVHIWVTRDNQVITNGQLCMCGKVAYKEFRPTKRAVDVKPRKPRKVKSRKASHH